MKSNKFLVLKPTEERIFILLQKYGVLSVSEISKKLNLARTSIYNSLESLSEKNIVVKTDFLYSLKNMALVKHSIKKEDSFRKIESFLNEVTELKRGEIVYSIETDAEIKELFNDRNSFLRWQEKITKKGIVLKGVGSIDALGYFKNIINTNDKIVLEKRSGSARFLKEPLNGYCILIVFRDTIVFMSRVKRYFYRIDNVFISEFMKNTMDRIYVSLEYERLV